MLPQSILFISSLVGWLIGIFWPISMQISQRIILVLAFTLLACLLVRPLLFLVIPLLCFAVASWYITSFVQQITPVLPYYTQQVIEVTIKEKPSKSGDQALYIGHSAASWRASFWLPRLQIIEPGTTLRLSGTLLPAGDPTDRQAQLQRAKDRLFVRLNKPTILSSRPAKLNPWDRFIITSRSHFDETTSRLFTQPEAAIFAGIVAGIKSDLPAEILDAFRIAGLSHIIAVSGFNITIVMRLFTRFSQRFGRWPNFTLSVMAIIFFIIFTGATASVVRAGWLAGMLVAARVVERKGALGRLLLLTAVLMTLVNPLLLRYDIGFQLSFAALIGLMLFATPLTEKLTSWHLPSWIAEVLGSTIAASITTFPIITHYFGTFSTYAIVANLLVGPIIPILTALAIPLVMVTTILPYLAWLAYPFDLLLRYCLYVVQLIAQLPYAQLNVLDLTLIGWFNYGLILLNLYLLVR